MNAPISPRKQSLMPASKLRKALRAAGHHLSPVVQVGKEGVSEAVLRQLDEALLAHELVKVKVGSESPEDRFEAAARLAGEPHVQVAQVIGRVVLAYRKHPRTPRFEPGPPALDQSKITGKRPKPRRPAIARPAPRRPAKASRSQGDRTTRAPREGATRAPRDRTTRR